ncbi:MAG: hypothetical protein QHH19_04630 [Candidatus Thermoplasmatota archaeon]|nr:hypothetical protein [Candidatus Thermoplasmatota archaeon]
MNLKILTIAVMLMVLGGTFLSAAELNNNAGKTATFEIKEIRVAIFTDDTLDENFYGPYGRTVHFLHALEDYSWKVGSITYCFKTTILRTEDILKGRLTTNNFDVLLYPPDSVNEYSTSYGRKMLPRNIMRKNRMVNFVKAGGGFFGTCGGGLVAGDLKNKPITLLEKLYKNCCLGISKANVYFQNDLPVFGQLSIYGYKYAHSGGYITFSGWNLTDYDINYHVGVCLDVPILNDNAIFDDYCKDTCRIRWIGGPPYILPENSENIKVLAKFPAEEISDNESTRIHYWKYVGGLRGMAKAMIFGKNEILWGETLNPFMKALIYAEDWKMMDDIVETNFSNKPFMITEIYDNENQARIVRCVGHPEDNVWWGGHIEELDDTKNNNMFDGFHRWRDIIPENETVEDEFSYTFWIVRRSVAWASKKVPDNDLPPIYGSSEVRDFDSYNQSLEFTIYGNAEESNSVESLDLYYRYSSDNISWGDWTLYGTDIDGSDGWSWKFNATLANGPGYYQFYSLRHVRYEHEWLNETAPPGSDAIAYVI